MTIEDVENEIKKVYLLNDSGVIKMLLATVIANKLKLSTKPIWLLILGGSSSGKTALIQTLDKCGDWIVPIDTLTTNTFASGLQRSAEVSLLWKANNGVLVFKDFTTITSMNEEGLREIMGQLRAIYDGSFKKETGNNVTVDWKGYVGIIAGGTIASQRKMRQFSEQGERFINYILTAPDSKLMTRKAIKNQKKLGELEGHLQDVVADFVKSKVGDDKHYDLEELEISDEIVEEMISVADFCTMARSPVLMNRQKPDKVEFVGDREQPSRVAMMFTNIAQALMILSDQKKLSDENAEIIYKSAMDSVPVERRLVLKLLGQYKSATTKNLAIRLNYPTEPVRSWCNQLNALKMINRLNTSGTSDLWELKPEYKKVVVKYEKIFEEEDELTPTMQEINESGLEDEYGMDADDTMSLGSVDFSQAEKEAIAVAKEKAQIDFNDF